MIKKNEFKEIIALLTKALQREDLILLIHYGSSLYNIEGANDLDFLAVCKQVAEEVELINLGAIDLVKIDLGAFKIFERYLDPAFYTEPILTGRLVHGDPEEFRKQREQIKRRRADFDVVKYLFERSVNEHQKFLGFLRERLLDHAFSTLSFAVTYHAYSRWYLHGGKPIPLSSLIEISEEGDFLRKLFDRLKKAKRGGYDQREIEELYSEWIRIMLRKKGEAT